MKTTEIIGIICFLIAVIGGLYIGIYLGIINPILTLITAIETETVTGGLVAIQFLWFFFKEILAWLWFVIFFVLSKVFIN